MIVPGPAPRLFPAPDPIELGRSFDGLHGLVRAQLQEDPRSGHLFLFCTRRRTRLKVLCFDGTGLGVDAQRLEQGRFTWPGAEAGPQVRGCAAELALLWGGLELTRVRCLDWWHPEWTTPAYLGSPLFSVEWVGGKGGIAGSSRRDGGT